MFLQARCNIMFCLVALCRTECKQTKHTDHWKSHNLVGKLWKASVYEKLGNEPANQRQFLFHRLLFITAGALRNAG
jgi:hypothetical protein